jgi:RsiW-degrading membrane proteinase PrsW (M82 family)
MAKDRYSERYVACLRPLFDQAAVNSQQFVYRLGTMKSLILGRDSHCDIALNPAIHRSVSRRHAEVSLIRDFAAPDGMRFWQICDLQSSNGTYINGQRLDGCQVLRAGDRIMLGQNGPEFIFECQVSDAISPAEVAMASGNAADFASIPAYPTAPSPHQRSSPRKDTVSLTQLFPLLSTGQELAHKAYLIPAIATIVFVVLLFLSIGNPTLFNLLLASYLAGAAYFCIYQICGKHKPWWVIIGVALATIVLLLSPGLELFTFIFHKLLPGSVGASNTDGFLVTFVKIFFGAGLMEELLKAVPVLGLYWLGRSLPAPWRESVGVWEPLDGILLGAAAAVGFALMETLGVYVPATYKSSLMAGQEAAQLAGLQLLIPRVLGLVAGHMAYSGYLGYFIGLSALRRRQRWLILAVGYVSAALLHTLWNAAGLLSPVFLAGVGVVSYACLGAAILKARELSPMRSQNFATRFFR